MDNEKEQLKAKIRERYKGVNTEDCEIIPAIEKPKLYDENNIKRVAAYARVSTIDINQTTSYELQKNHYTDLINRHEGWSLVKIYADEGISGTSLNHRDSFVQMIEDCKQGKIDLIVTKSVSRFARNTLDCLDYIRQLKDLPNPVGILFETENIYTLDSRSEMALSFLATMAQEESHIKSDIMNASLEMRFSRGILLTPALLGYDKDENGNLVINREEAITVKLIFFMYLYGNTCKQIAEILTEYGRKTKKGNTKWAPSSVLQVLQNERHCGDVLTRKTWTPNYLNHNSNMAEINPYVISELGAGGGMAALMSGGGTLANDIELMQSPLVIDKVIQDNDLRVKKLFGIIPTKKTGQYLTTEKFLKKGISFENKKGTNVVTIEYKNKDRELAYNVVNSIIVHYLELNKEINTTKSKSDKKIIESEYLKAKADLNSKMNSVSGLPSTAVSGSGGLAALSSISKSAQKAMSGIQGQYVSGVKSEMRLREDAEKVAALSSKLEWAKLVDQMSESSKVIVLKEPRQLQEYEQSSPKLFTNILLGIVFGVIASLIAVILAENTDKKLTYSMLGENIIYNLENDLTDLKMVLLANQDKKISLVVFEQIPRKVLESLKDFSNLNMIRGDISKEFVSGIQNSSNVIIFATVNKTDAKLYKQVKKMIQEMNKNVLNEVLV